MTTRDRTVLGIVVGVALLAAYWFLFLAPQRDEAKKLGTQVEQEQRTASDARAEIASARAAKRSYAKNYATLARLGQAVPTDDNVPSLVFQLDAAARATHVDFRAVKLVGSSAPAPAPALTAPATPSGSSTPASSSSSGSAAPAAAAPATQAATATLPPGAAVGPAGFPTMPFSLTFDGSFFHVAAFFHRLQRFVDAGGRSIRVGGRLLTLDGLSLSASRHGFPRVKAIVAATAYLIPAGEGLTDGATPSAPGATTPASTSSSTATPAPATIVR